MGGGAGSCSGASFAAGSVCGRRDPRKVVQIVEIHLISCYNITVPEIMVETGRERSIVERRAASDDRHGLFILPPDTVVTSVLYECNTELRDSIYPSI